MENFKNQYKFPDYYNWPFFFTLQKHAETRMKQLQMWMTIYLEFCKENKIWRISKGFFYQHLGINRTINRKLNYEFVNIIFEYLCKNGKIFPLNKEEGYVLWRSIDEWREWLYDTAVKHHRVDTIETLDYLISDEEVQKEEFYGMDKDLLIFILKSLEKKGKCILLKEDTGKYVGIKFIK